MTPILDGSTNYRSLSLRDLLQARDQYHWHLHAKSDRGDISNLRADLVKPTTGPTGICVNWDSLDGYMPLTPVAIRGDATL